MTPDQGTDISEETPLRDIPDSLSNLHYLTCEICGHAMDEQHCKIICKNCGYTRDCSDP